MVATGAQITTSFATQGMGTLAPFFINDLGLNRAQIGFLGGAVNFGMAFTSLLAGIMVDRIGEKIVLIGGGVLAGVTMLAASQVSSFPALAALFIFAGFWTASATPAGSKGIMSWFPESKRGFALGFRQTGLPLGGAISAIALPSLAILYSWRAAVAGTGLIIIGGSLLVLFFYRESPTIKQQEKKNGHAGSSLKKLLLNSNLWLICISSVLLIGIQFSIIGYLELFFHEDLGFSVRLSSYMLALAQLAGMAGRLFWGIASDKLFRGKRKKPFLLAASLISLICLFMSFVQYGMPWWLLVSLSCMLGFTAIGWNGLFIAILSELAGREAAGTSLGIGLTIIQLGVLVIPPFFGFVVDYTGSYQNGWLILSGLSMLGAGILSFVREKKL